MSLKEILEVGGMIVSLPVMAYGLGELGKKYVAWAEKNEFCDEKLEKDDMKENPVDYTNKYK